MREIKFRGKRVDNGEWVYGYAVKGCDKDNQMFIAQSIGVGFFTGGISAKEVIPETDGQFTGLKDKNGIEIFEGDVVEFESHGYIPKKEKGTVIFKDGCYGIDYLPECYRKIGWNHMFHRLGGTSEWQEMGAHGTITYTYEVVGNIHDNKLQEYMNEEAKQNDRI